MGRDDHTGFRIVARGGATVVECVMPPCLDGEVAAAFYCRGTAMEGAGGDIERVARALGYGGAGRLAAPRQVHGTAIMRVRPAWALPCRPSADGVFLDRSFTPRGTAGSLRFADCSPILLASPDPRPWAIALHSGFVGTTRNIFQNAWRTAERRYGAAFRPDRLYVWIGPAICGRCYDRSRDDASTLAAMRSWHEGNFRASDGGAGEGTGERVLFDIRAEIASQAEDAGARAENVFSFPLCTSCRNDILFSYRRGDRVDRMLMIVELTGA